MNSAAFTGIPVCVDLEILNEKCTNEGAILLCDEITAKRMTNPPSELKNWGKRVAARIWRYEKETRTQGFRIITAVHSTQRCAIKCWSDPHRTREGSLNTRFYMGGETVGFRMMKRVQCLSARDMATKR